jgi:hypothetical protein
MLMMSIPWAPDFNFSWRNFHAARESGLPLPMMIAWCCSISAHKKSRRGSSHRKSRLPDLRMHEKTDLGQAQDRRTLREFQFPE